MNSAADKLSPFLATSAMLHVMLVVLVMFAPSLFPSRQNELWGTSTDPHIRAGMMSSLPGVPLPSPPVVQETARGYTGKSLNPAEAAPKPEVKPAPVEADVKVPSGNARPERKPAPAPPSAPQNDAPAPVASNAIPGRGGQMALPYGQVGSGGAQASFGDQTFGTLFPDYVRNMTRAITASWQDSIVGVPRGSSSRVYVTFTIQKRGQASDLEIAQSSGSVQLDNSAKRAVLAAKLPPLPAAYSGSSIDVRFYFEYTR